MMKMPYLVRSDGRQCWNLFRNMRVSESLVVSPYEAIQEKDTGFCDPFGAGRSVSAEELIHSLKLEYLGVVERGGKPCHRIRSWLGQPVSQLVRGGIQDWLIDAQTLLPAIKTEYVENLCAETEFLSDRVNQRLPTETFQAPSHPGLKPQPLRPLEEGCDHYFLKVRDGSDGRMTVHFGQIGTRSPDGGLN